MNTETTPGAPRLLNDDIVFADVYEDARASFLTLSEGAGAETQSHRHPTAIGIDGAPLFVDTAYFGPRDARKVLLSISGVHGQEFYAGSAAQRRWIRSERWRKVPDDLGILFVHALNPFGCAWFSRTTENNVDLNRNFIDHTKPHQKNPTYGELIPLLKLGAPSEKAFADFEKKIAGLEESIGIEKFRRAVMRGQYEHPEATAYGGVKPEWSNTLLRRIVTEHLGTAQFVGLIDWHTGIGPTDGTFIVCFHNPGEPAFDHVCDWWGKSNVEKSLSSFGEFEFRPDFSGLAFQGVRESLPNAEVIGAVIEFGTYSPEEVSRAILVDLWLRFDCPDPAGEDAAYWCAYMMERLWPQSPDWRNNCLRLSDDLYSRTVAGLAAL